MRGDCADRAISWLVMLLYALLVGTFFWLIQTVKIRAQEHEHPPQDLEIHEKFYSTWFMPDKPESSCCNQRDCYPAEAKPDGAGWLVRRREDGKWLPVPGNKMEWGRDSPDGRSHVCASSPMAGDYVYCFILGAGG